MSFACIYVPDFPVEAVIRTEPELREQPVAVVEGRPPLLSVVAANEIARHLGVEIGMTQVQAQGRAPGIALRKRSPLQEDTAHAALVDCACAISPRVHDETADTILLDLSGMNRLFGSAAKMARDLARRVSELGMETNVGVAANVETAIHAARGFSGITVIPRGKEAERLAPLSVDVLFRAGEERAEEMLDTLERWGVRTFRALALLPEIALSERLGERGLYLRKMARGEGSRTLIPAEAPLDFEEAIELEDAIDLLEPLAFILNRMLEQLCARLATRSLAAHELYLRMQLDPQEDVQIQNPDHGFAPNHTDLNSEMDHSVSPCLRDGCAISEYTLKFPVPMLDAKVFLKLLQLELRARPPQAPVMKIWLRAEPAHPRLTQGGLFLPTAPEPEKLEVTLARISSVVTKHSAVSTQQSETAIAPRRHTDTGKTDSKSEINNHKSEIGVLRVGTAEVLDTHRPDAFRMKRFAPPIIGDSKALRRKAGRTSADSSSEFRAQNSELQGAGLIVLRRFRPALIACVQLQNGRPVRLDAGDSHAGDVIWAAGPWRSSGEWWNEQQWSRDTWDIAVKSDTVTLYRMYCEREQWWLEGTYD